MTPPVASCPRCGGSIAPEAARCTSCGADLDSGAHSGGVRHRYMVMDDGGARNLDDPEGGTITEADAATYRPLWKRMEQAKVTDQVMYVMLTPAEGHRLASQPSALPRLGSAIVMKLQQMSVTLCAVVLEVPGSEPIRINLLLPD
jgi:hypothetical protein